MKRLSALLLLVGLLLPSLATAQSSSSSATNPRFRMAYGLHRGTGGSNLRLLQSNELEYGYDDKGRLQTLKIGGCEISVAGFETCAEENAAANLAQLTSGVDFQYHLFESNMENEIANLGFGNMTFDRNEVLVVVEFFQRRIYRCSGVAEAHLGIGLLLAIKVPKNLLKKGIDLARLAALGEGRGSQIQYSLRTFGLTGPAITNMIPNTTHFNTDAYEDYLRLVNVVRNLGNIRQNLIVCPEPLPFAVYEAPARRGTVAASSGSSTRTGR